LHQQIKTYPHKTCLIDLRTFSLSQISKQEKQVIYGYGKTVSKAVWKYLLSDRRKPVEFAAAKDLFWAVFLIWGLQLLQAAS
jgi:hypothetical protein